MNLNKASLIGNLTDDPAARKLPSGQSLTRFGIATNHVWKDAKTKEKRENVEYHAVVAWGKLADIIAKYVKKGSKVYVEGRLNTRKWEDKEGVKRNKTEVVADNLIMLGHRGTKATTQTQTETELAEEEVDLEKVPADE